MVDESSQNDLPAIYHIRKQAFFVSNLHLWDICKIVQIS